MSHLSVIASEFCSICCYHARVCAPPPSVPDPFSLRKMSFCCRLLFFSKSVALAATRWGVRQTVANICDCFSFKITNLQNYSDFCTWIHTHNVSLKQFSPKTTGIEKVSCCHPCVSHCLHVLRAKLKRVEAFHLLLNLSALCVKRRLPCWHVGIMHAYSSRSEIAQLNSLHVWFSATPADNPHVLRYRLDIDWKTMPNLHPATSIWFHIECSFQIPELEKSPSNIQRKDYFHALFHFTIVSFYPFERHVVGPLAFSDNP